MTHITIDIETVPPPLTDELQEQLAGEVKLGNLKDPAKIAAKIEESVPELHERLSLDPRRNVVVVVGVATDWSEPAPLTLEGALDLIAAHPGAFLVGHNIDGFDIQTLAIKAARLGHPACRVLWGHLAAKPWERRIHDTMKASGWRTSFGKLEAFSLDGLCEMLGLPGPRPGSINGPEVYDAYKRGDHAAIVEHVLDDVRRERRAYLRCCELGIGGWSLPQWARGSA